ncbi:MAG: VWA domain-containing protein [Pyrinomonadaceae bacterium]
MNSKVFSRISLLLLICAVVLSFAGLGFPQSRPQKPTTTNGKKNNRPTPKTPEEIQKEKEAAEQAEMEKNAIDDGGVVVIDTKLINVDAVVIEKKSGRIVAGLKKENFRIFEEGKDQPITSFSEPDAPITVSLVVEYSKWSELFGSASGGYFEAGHLEVIRPVAQFVTGFVKAPDDYASIIAFDIRPTPITDFTNDPSRFQQSINLLLRNRPAFRENNLYDAVNFALVGGRTDSVVLEDSEESKTDYAGLVDVRSGRRAIILVASGIDTFSKLNYDEIRKVIRESGVPIFIISTGNLFYKKYEHLLGPTDSITGVPGRLTFLQAKNAMNVFARESGGAHYEMTFPGEIPGILQNINALMRSQYSLAYDARSDLEPGKKYKLVVKVDVNGDGQFDDKQFEVRHRPYFSLPGKEEKKKKKK